MRIVRSKLFTRTMYYNIRRITHITQNRCLDGKFTLNEVDTCFGLSLCFAQTQSHCSPFCLSQLQGCNLVQISSRLISYLIPIFIESWFPCMFVLYHIELKTLKIVTPNFWVPYLQWNQELAAKRCWCCFKPWQYFLL